MIDHFEYILYRMFAPDRKKDSFPVFDPAGQFDENATDDLNIAKSLNAAFLITLADKRHRLFKQAESFIREMTKHPRWAGPASNYQAGKKLIHKEIKTACEKNPGLADHIEDLYEWLSTTGGCTGKKGHAAEKTWSIFFPEGKGISETIQESIKELRQKRMINITNINDSPLSEPGRQVLFTSNVLLTVPDKSMKPKDLDLTSDLKDKIFQAAGETQDYWYDHPVQIGIKPDQNEILYGLYGLNKTAEFERKRGNMPNDKITCLLSVSVTHHGLQGLAKKYLEEEISRSRDFHNINTYVFTEADTKLIIREILTPAAKHYIGNDNAIDMLNMFGVDGEYGRHYSFLKAISAFWNILIDPEIKATFKIDLDQIFPQKELVEQTGASAFEHFKTALWGARGTDSEGKAIELGMIAGSLVNEKDISKSVFTPDVAFPHQTLSSEERVFFSALPQALSTEAEMMTRYDQDYPDGKKTCIQRIHVTGGTNGILVDSLRRHRPFTPSFIGRAEDQAYILSVLPGREEQLAYVHKDGLIMRHDKEAFAQDAIKAASTGKLVGDYIRTLFFSKYAKVLDNDISRLKRVVDPFTGCFISSIPTTLVFLRFCLKAASFFASGRDKQACYFITMGMPRIQKTLKFVDDENGLLKQIYKKERLGWDLYYDILESIEQGLKTKDPLAVKLRDKAKDIIRQCLVKGRD